MLRVNSSWVKLPGFLAYPYGWQRPAKTEEWAYEQMLKSLPDANFSQLLCFPWATLIDLLRAGNKEMAKPFIGALENTPPKDKLVRATVCQHIYAKDMLPWFSRLKITDVYWSHAKLGEPKVAGVRIHPFPLYPVNCEPLCSDGNIRSSISRRFLYSFIGYFDPELYLKSTRQWIFDLPARQDSVIIKRNEWHYERQVYDEQISGLAISQQSNRQHEYYGLKFTELMRDSLFSLCPSGSGPNSIRIWESLGLGSIPVILADELRLPGSFHEWKKACVFLKEDEEEVKKIPMLLESLANDKSRIRDMQEAGFWLWKKYGVNGPSTILNELADLGFVKNAVSRSAV